MRRLLSLVASATFVAIASTYALGQGSDSCMSPTLVSGGTSFPFNNATATQGTESAVWARSRKNRGHGSPRWQRRLGDVSAWCCAAGFIELARRDFAAREVEVRRRALEAYQARVNRA